MTAQISGHSPLVTIIGGSGFVGRNIAQRMARRGWRVRVACRRPNEAMHVKPYGTVGQVEPVQCNIRDEASTRAVIRGADAVINCVGLLFNSGRNTQAACHVEGAGRVARIAAGEGVAHLVHLSAIGADADGNSEYARTKAAGDAAVTAAFPGAVILRPSVVFGQDDGFFNRFAGMARLLPLVLPTVGAAEAGVYELGGPAVFTLREAIELMLRVTRRRRLILNIPFFIARIDAWFLQMLPNPLLTVDQVKLLEHDNVVAEGAATLADLGIQPTAAEGVIEGYLYAYRPQGQYTQLTENGGKA
jgi:NADH dehydrogenase